MFFTETKTSLANFLDRIAQDVKMHFLATSAVKQAAIIIRAMPQAEYRAIVAQLNKTAREEEDTEVTQPTNFDVWKEALTPEFIAEGKFIVLSCGACPANGITCKKYDTTCRSNFLLWARARAEAKEARP